MHHAERVSRRRRQEHEFDILIYATGFDGVTGAFDRIDIRGTNGVRLKDAWAESPRTYPRHARGGLSQHADGPGPAHRARQHPAGHRAQRGVPDRLLRFMREHNYTRVETRPEQVEEWTQTVIKAAEPLLSIESQFLADRREP